MLTGFFETYLKLNGDEERRLQTEIQKFDPKEVKIVELISSYRRKGREEGRIEGKKDSICTFLEAKFGSDAVSMQEKVRSIDDLPLLDEVLKKVFAANSLKETQTIIEESIRNNTGTGASSI